MLLLTGATGLVGGELLKLFAAAPDPAPASPAGYPPGLPVAAFCRPLPAPRRRPGGTPMDGASETVRGDLCLPHLGLSPDKYGTLQDRVTAILHCAADTRFGLPLESAREVNTAGTARLLEFARGCPRMDKFGYVSTVYVAGDRTGAIPESFGPSPRRFFNTYQQSKYEAEALVNRAAADLPVMVLRLSSIAGDSETGRVRRFNYVHQMIRLLPRNILPVAPGDLDAPADLIPTGYAAGAIFHIFTERFTPGMTCQICAGPERSLTLRQMLALTLEAVAATGRFPAVQAPRFVALDEYERYAREQSAGGSALLCQVLAGLGHFLPHLALRQEFANANSERLLAGSGVTLPPVAGYFPKVVAYCLGIT